jgi:hypothetical protein
MNVVQAPETGAAEAQAVSAVDLLEAWVEVCNEFRRRRRRQMVERQPSAQELAAYREDLKWLMRSARSLLGIASDPEFPARRRFAPEIAGKLLQLQSYWESLNNPKTVAGADALIQKHFPDETGVGSPAQGL